MTNSASGSRPSMVDWEVAVSVGSRIAGEGPTVSADEAATIQGRAMLVKRLKPILSRGKRGGPTRPVARQRHATFPRQRTRRRIGGASARACAAHVVDQLRQLVEFGRPAQDVHLRMAAKQIDPVSLGHAAQDAEDQVFAFALAHPDGPHAAVRLLLGLLADGTRVVEHDLRVAVALDERVAELCQLATDELAVELVHLATERFEVDAHANSWRASIMTGPAAAAVRPEIPPTARHASPSIGYPDTVDGAEHQICSSQPGRFLDSPRPCGMVRGSVERFQTAMQKGVDRRREGSPNDCFKPASCGTEGKGHEDSFYWHDWRWFARCGRDARWLGRPGAVR